MQLLVSDKGGNFISCLSIYPPLYDGRAIKTSPFVVFSISSFANVHVTSPGAPVVCTSPLSSVLFVVVVVLIVIVVELNGFVDDVSSLVMVEGEALVDALVDAVIGFLLSTAVVLGRWVVLRVTEVDLTVELVTVGFDVVNVGFTLAVVFSTDSTENVVTNISSVESVVGSTFTIKSVGFGRGRGAFLWFQHKKLLSLPMVSSMMLKYLLASSW